MTDKKISWNPKHVGLFGRDVTLLNEIMDDFFEALKTRIDAGTYHLGEVGFSPLKATRSADSRFEKAYMATGAAEVLAMVVSKYFQERYGVDLQGIPKENYSLYKPDGVMRRVVCAAELYPCGVLLVGPRHYDSIMALQYHQQEHRIPIDSVAVDGFLDQFGIFMDRYEALAVAKNAGQIREKTQPENKLFSEDLY